MKLHVYTGKEIRDLRRKAGMNQTQFWTCFGTGQWTGSRYESGQSIPTSVQVLLNLALQSEEVSLEILGRLRAPFEKAASDLRRGSRS